MSDSDEEVDLDRPTQLDDPQTLKERGKALKRNEQERQKMIQALMGLKQGRRYVWEILEMCHVFRTSFATNALVMSMNEGERNIGLWIYADLTAYAQQEYLLMLSENSNAVQK